MKMYVRPYLYFVKLKMLGALTYRFDIFSALLGQFLVLIGGSFLWRAVYAYAPEQETTLQQMLLYVLMSELLRCFFSTTVESEMKSRIRQGSIAQDLIKPVGLFGMYLAGDIGNIVANAALLGVPLLVFSSIFIVAPIPASALGLILFLISAMLSFLILWQISAIFGALHFWLIDLGDISGVKNHLLAFLSGSLVPLWFFPKWVQDVSAFLPFIYMYQIPVSFFIGQTPPAQAPRIFAIQIFWILFFFGLLWLVKKRTMRHLVVQGG